MQNSSFPAENSYEGLSDLNNQEIEVLEGTSGMKDNVRTKAALSNWIIPSRNFEKLDVVRQQRKFQLLQFWEGRVDELVNEGIVAIIRDKTNPSNPEEEATILLEEISDEDIDLVRPGAVFYWSIGYEDAPSRRRISQIRFRRLPGWTKREIIESEKKAKEFSSLFV